jgi:predicted RND superfamily exporter protein
MGAFGAPSNLLDLPEALREPLRSMLAADGAIRAVAYVEDIELLSLERTLAELRQVSGDAGGSVAGELVTYAEFAERVPSTLYRSLGTCLLLVGLLMLSLLVALRIPRKSVILLSAFWGSALLIALLWLLRVPLTFLTCIFASVLVGLTGDNVIQYVFATRREGLGAGLRRRGGASILVAVCMALASLVFMGSAFVPSRTLGMLLALGFIASVAGDLWILRGLLAGSKRAATGPRPQA